MSLSLSLSYRDSKLRTLEFEKLGRNERELVVERSVESANVNPIRLYSLDFDKELPLPPRFNDV